MRTLTAADHGSEVGVEPGETVEVRLPQLGGTAFLWSVVSSTNVIVVDDHVEIGGDGAPAPGAESARVLRLRCVDDGPARLRLVRARPWETDEERDAEFEVVLTPIAGSS